VGRDAKEFGEGVNEKPVRHWAGFLLSPNFIKELWHIPGTAKAKATVDIVGVVVIKIRIPSRGTSEINRVAPRTTP
jgi:hypothetical protein